VRHDGRDFALGPDRLLIIADNTLFHCCGEPGVSHLWVHFTPPPESSVVLQAPHALTIDQPLRCTAEELVAAHRSSAGAQLGHTAAALLHMTFARLEHAPAAEYPPRLEELLRFIEESPAGDLSNEQLARKCAMSQSAFIRWFGELTGTTPAAWVQESRTNRAAQLLALSDLSIEQIASDCGFPNRYYFSRVFRQHQGCGPAEYRKRQVRW
jgi:AraC-like DNA-binding protein